jgi:hypothetical protein
VNAAATIRLAIASDIHYASAAEQQRPDYELAGVRNPFKRAVLQVYHRIVWTGDPFARNHLLDAFVREASACDFVVANGDYSCDSGFVGVSDDAACQSVRECLQKLRQAVPGSFQATIGDHELGKIKLGGGLGRLCLASYGRAQDELGLQPFWQVRLGRYVLMGVTSTLLALPIFEPEAQADELPAWRQLRERHLDDIRRAFAALQPEERVLLFCHDPSALPFLGQVEIVRAHLSQVEQTIIGHLHTRWVLFKSRLLAGMPVIRGLGNMTRRVSTALHAARDWKPFRVRLCPALSGARLFRDGGYLRADLDPEARQPARFQFHPLRP